MCRYWLEILNEKINIYELNEYQIRRRSTFSMQFWFHLKMNQSFQILCILVRNYAYVIIIRVPGLLCSKLDTDCIETLEYRVAAMVFCLRTCKIYWGMQIVLYKWSFCWWYQGFSFKSILKYFPNECRILVNLVTNCMKLAITHHSFQYTGIQMHIIIVYTKVGINWFYIRVNYWISVEFSIVCCIVQ